MADARLVEYLKQGMERGVPFATMLKRLYQSGWDDYEIDEAMGVVLAERHIQKTPPPPPPQPKVEPQKGIGLPKWLPWAGVGVATLLVLVFLGFLISKLPLVAIKPRLDSPATTSQILDCGSNIVCFASSAATCRRARLNTNVTLTQGEVGVTEGIMLEIKGNVNGLCKLHYKELSATLTPDSRAKALGNGFSEEWLSQKQQEINLRLASEPPKEICIGATQLSNILLRWGSGNYYYEDFTGQPCPTPQNCNLQLTPEYLTLERNQRVSVQANGFTDSKSLTWSSSKPEVVAVELLQGESTRVRGVSFGAAEIIVTDNSAGADCTASMRVEVI